MDRKSARESFIAYRKLEESDADSQADSIMDNASAPTSEEVARHGWLKVPLVIMLGLGSHFSKNALAPAEPMLHSLGVSPVAYAGICAAPTIATVILPTFWGMIYTRYERLSTVSMPLGILVGQFIMNFGLEHYNYENMPKPYSKLMLLLGLVVISVFRAASDVVQHTLLSRLLPDSLMKGFSVVICSTHLIVMGCNFFIPKVLASGGADPMVGMLRVVWLLTIPSVFAVLSACIVCCTMPPDGGRARKKRGVTVRGTLRSVTMKSSTMVPWWQRSVWRGRFLLMWGALIVGFLHGFQSITNGLIVSLGFSVTGAGTVIAKSQGIALFAIPFVSVLDNWLGGGAVMLITSLLALGGSSIMTLATFIELNKVFHVIAVFCLSLAGSFAPVIALSLLPKNVRKIGKSYGVLDSLKSIAQISTVFSLGVIRTAAGFQGATVFTSLGMCVVVALAIQTERSFVSMSPDLRVTFNTEKNTEVTFNTEKNTEKRVSFSTETSFSVNSEKSVSVSTETNDRAG